MDFNRAGNKNPNWRGGRSLKKDGYIYVQCHGHPSADKSGTVLEHILVAEKMLGHRLPIGSRVHHINHNRSDNRPENLEVLTEREHRHAHARDRVEEMGGDFLLDKICSRCKKLMARIKFHKSKSTYDGLDPRCKQCTFERQSESLIVDGLL